MTGAEFLCRVETQCFEAHLGLRRKRHVPNMSVEQPMDYHHFPLHLRTTFPKPMALMDYISHEPYKQCHWGVSSVFKRIWWCRICGSPDIVRTSSFRTMKLYEIIWNYMKYYEIMLASEDNILKSTKKQHDIRACIFSSWSSQVIPIISHHFATQWTFRSLSASSRTKRSMVAASTDNSLELKRCMAFWFIKFIPKHG